MTEHQKAQDGKLFDPLDPALVAVKRTAHNLCAKYNLTLEDDPVRNTILHELLKELGEDVYFQGPIQFNYGCNTIIGSHFFANYNCIVLDDTSVTIGSHCMFGPNVTIATPMHPLLPLERREVTDSAGRSFLPCYAQPVVIGDDVWIASNVVVCAGVTIGDGSVIGAGSVVTRDIPPLTLAVGNPCRPVRKICPGDSVLPSRLF